MSGTEAQAVSRDGGWRDRVYQFFYAEEVPYGLALTRMALPLVLLGAFVPRWWHARELFSTDGSPTPLWIGYGLPNWLPEPSAPMAVALCTALIFFLVTTSLGWRTRLSAFAACLLVAYLSMLDTIGTLTKYSVLASHLLLLLSVSNCGDVWSVDAWLSRRKRHCLFDPTSGTPRSSVWPRRLIQILIGTTYFAAAMTKLQTPAFFSGDQMLFWMLTNLNPANPVGEWASLYPPMIICMGFATLVWEILFLFLCWRGIGRIAVVGIGVVFHILTWLLLGLILFPLLCLTAYWTFYSEQDIQKIARFVRRWSRQSALMKRVVAMLSWRPSISLPQGVTPRNAGWGFAAALAVVLMAGIEAEQQFDLYGMTRTDGPYELKPLSHERAAELLSATEAVRAEDKLFSFYVGTTTLGGVLANRRATFRPGDKAIAECSVIPPHEDLWAEVNLHDADNRLILNNGQILPREKWRTHFHYEFQNALPPGDYDFVLRLDGQEVSRRRITLMGSSAATASATTADAAPVVAISAGVP